MPPLSPKALPISVNIELATRHDANEIAALSRSEIEHGFRWRWTPPRVAAAITNRQTNVAVARANGKLLGFGIMRYYQDSAHLELFAVRPETRNQGVGSAILCWLEHVAAMAGIAKIKVEARAENTAAIAFYQKQGYVVKTYIEDMYQGIEDGIRLEKVLFKKRQDVTI